MTVLTDMGVALGPDDFRALSTLARQVCGIMLNEEKVLMVQSRLRPRLRATNINNFRDYISFVSSSSGQSELRMMISALTTNVTQFFREAHHFDLLKSDMLPRIRKKLERGEKVRIWSAGCSYGQEAYSLAMYLLHNEPKLAANDFRILATDIDPKAIAQARLGKYDAQHVSAISTVPTDAYFVKESKQPASLQVSKEVSRFVTFKELNLLSDWPMKGQFDAIFCRNVVIYFDNSTQEQLWPRLNKMLCADGLLFLGHSERILDPGALGLTSIGPTAYKKTLNLHGKYN